MLVYAMYDFYYMAGMEWVDLLGKNFNLIYLSFKDKLYFK